MLTKLSEALFVDTLRRFVAGLPDQTTGWLAGARDPVVGKSLALLHRRASHPWTIAELAMAVGLSCGMGYMGYGIIVALVLCVVMLALEHFKFGKTRSNAKLLKITIPENLDYQDAFDTVLNKYALNYNLQKVKTTDLGSLYELVYTVTTRPDIRDRDFIDELRCRNGNLNITLIMTPQSGEY